MREFLTSFESAADWLRRMGFSNPQAAHRDFVRLAERGLPLDLLEWLANDLARTLPGCSNPDMAFNNLERFLNSVPSPLPMVTFLQQRKNSLAALIQLFSASQFFSDLMIQYPDDFNFLWEHGHAKVDPKRLFDDLIAEIHASPSPEMEFALRLIRRTKQRELLRIGYRDIILGEPLERITQSISDLADCLIEFALAFAYRRLCKKYGEPRSPDGVYSQIVVLAMGKLGGQELNYSSDIDFMLVHHFDGRTDGKQPIDNSEFFSLVTRDLVHLLSANTALGQAYRVDLRLRPHGRQSSLCLSLANTLAYYDQYGRTWERQALVKVRPVAGSRSLGQLFLKGIDAFVYRRYLSFVEINEIKSIKRTIQVKTTSEGGDSRNLKTGRGGIRDIEFVTQFLQLLNGRAIPDIRERNTLAALRRLAHAGCINQDEHTALETAYRFLRKAEHRLQFMFDLQTHTLPNQPEEMDRLAVRLGYPSLGLRRPGDDFRDDLSALTERARHILTRLMMELFPDDATERNGVGEPETDLILDPDPAPEKIQAVLGRYPFSDPRAAFQDLLQLSKEEIPFLSSVRCRHFLASVAPRLLNAVAEAPDPDMALRNLEKVTASLGAKGVLWESCAVNPPILRLYVQLCSWSQYLSEILINNPGMIDELLDSLVMNHPPTLAEMRSELGQLLRGARDLDRILHSFRDTRLLQIGVQDILGKKDLRQTSMELSELAETVVSAIADLSFQSLLESHGTPIEEETGTPTTFTLLAMGKFGGQELSYHSDVDLVLIYNDDGRTMGGVGKRSVTNFEFFTELAQQIAKIAARMGPFGRLYQVDYRLRPTGRSGNLVFPLAKFTRYYETKAALWERLALNRARPVHGAALLAEQVMSTVRRSICAGWSDSHCGEALAMRKRLEQSRPIGNLKRGAGGLFDIEFAVQLLQVKRGADRPEILQPNLTNALSAIAQTGLWRSEIVDKFRSAYAFLRTVESRLRIVYNRMRDELPDEPKEISSLANRLGFEGPAAGADLIGEVAKTRATVRTLFLEIIAAKGDFA